MTDREKLDLSKIEPIGKPPDAGDEEAPTPAIGRTAPIVPGAPPAVGVRDDVVTREPEPRTSPESEEELEKLRRG